MQMLVDVTQTRVLRVEGTNKLHPTSVFIMGPQGLCMEFDREEFRTLLIRELFVVPSVVPA